jgi:hypothetical protein
MCTTTLVSGFDLVEIFEGDRCPNPDCGEPIRRHDFVVWEGEVQRICHTCHCTTLRLHLAAVPVSVDEDAT